MTLASAAQPLILASVTGFRSVAAALFIYLGSTLWFLFLVGIDSGKLVMDASTGPVRDLYTMALVGNCAMFTLQTINVWMTTFRMWPVVSLYYTAQLWVLGLRAALVAIDSSNLAMSSLVLLAQCLFTSSQLSVTLEYLYRVSYTVQSLPPTRSLTTRRLPVAVVRHSTV